MAETVRMCYFVRGEVQNTVISKFVQCVCEQELLPDNFRGKSPRQAVEDILCKRYAKVMEECQGALLKNAKEWEVSEMCKIVPAQAADTSRFKVVQSEQLSEQIANVFGQFV